jgi:hypothetical protein
MICTFLEEFAFVLVIFPCNKYYTPSLEFLLLVDISVISLLQNIVALHPEQNSSGKILIILGYFGTDTFLSKINNLT